MPVFNVNTNEVVRFSRNLDLISKTALPKAAKDTINNVAFDIKKRTLPEEAAKSFTIRNPTFYKRFSKVKMAKGTSIKNMTATVGMSVQGAPQTAKQAIDDQAQQQLGGTIGGRTLIPFDQARTGNRHDRNVRAKFRVSKVNVDLDTANSKGATEKDRFINTVITALDRFGGEAIIQHRVKSGKEIIFHVKKGGRGFKTREFGVRVTPLYSVEEGRSVKIRDAKPITKVAARRAMLQVNKHFRRNAKRYFKKFL